MKLQKGNFAVFLSLIKIITPEYFLILNFLHVKFLKEVAYDEGYQLKMKFNLSWFDETNVIIENQTSQVIKKILMF